jgi:asparagine synthase (glutamine-hydrolysing)
MYRTGTDEAVVWLGRGVGLGQFVLGDTLAGQSDVSPQNEIFAELRIAAEARIDNRNELFTLLALPIGERVTAVPDSDLILAAYCRWGEACVEHLDGDWAFAIWDERKRKLFLAQASNGISALYYYSDARWFAFASSIKALLALPEVAKRPDRMRIAMGLVSWHDDGTLTAYEGIYRLPPAHTLTVEDGRVRNRRYWHPEKLEPLRLGSDDAYVEAFLHHYTEAVERRLRSSRPVGATLSGGLDSSSVCALAARKLGVESNRLQAFISVPLYKVEWEMGASFSDESPYADAIRDHLGNLDLEYVRAEHVSPLAGIERCLEACDEPGHAGSNMFWICALMERARDKGLGVLLTGQMGNGGVSWTGPPANLWQLLLRGDWPAIRQLQPTIPLIIRRNLIGPAVRPWRERWRRLKASGRQPWADYSAIHPEFARSMNLASRMCDGGHDPWFRRTSPIQDRLNTLKLGRAIVGSFWAALGQAYGLEVRDPTMDRRLIEFCLRIPPEQFQSPGTPRWLMRRAMRGLLPDVVRLNQKRGAQAWDIAYRVRASRAEIEAALRRLRNSGLAREILDLPRMSSVLQATNGKLDDSVTRDCGTILLRGLMTGLFLLRFDSTPG